MTAADYQVLLDLQTEAAEAHKKAAAAAEPWRQAALELARELTTVPVTNVSFKRDRISYICRGTGIYSHEEWEECYPIAFLFERLKITS